MSIPSSVVILCLFTNGFHCKCPRSSPITCEKLSDVALYGDPTWQTVIVENNSTKVNSQQNLTEQTFANTPNLERLSIVAQINQMEMPKIECLRKLTHVKINRNIIQTINFDAFPKGVPNKFDLDLRANSIENVEHGPFQNYSISSLDLSDNRLTEIRTNMVDIPNLKKLTISNNRILYIHPYCFHSDLEYLNLTYNSIGRIMGFLSYPLPNLNNLILADNKISFVPVMTSSENIKVLDLSHNEIETLHPGTFNYWFSLQNLSLSYNRLKYFWPDLIVKETPTLRRVIEYNHPDQRGVKFDLRKVYRFAEWSLAGNPWSCSYLEKIDEYFREMGIEHSKCDVKFFGNGESPVCVMMESSTHEFMTSVMKYEEC